jgi:hypothetical protein
VSDNESLVPSQRRLQRSPDFTGGRLNKFRDVAFRHGLPGALLGALCLLSPDMRELLVEALSAFLTVPLHYVFIALLIFGALLGYAWVLDRRLNMATAVWVLYLLGISIWEEWVFRVAVPYFGQSQGLDLYILVISSNLAFGALHYFTLRWKWQWCAAAFVGGMALSRNFSQYQDLALIVGLHWVATFINTPRMPGDKPNA